ncbi:MAG: hypothetical protein Q9202_001925 [Teloschistes flavicans]
MNETAPYTAAYLAEDNSQTLINVAIAMGTLETIFFSLFVWARAIAKTMHGLNFWLIPAAYLACFGHVITISIPLVLTVWVKHGGAGRHYPAITPAQFEIWLKVQFAEYFVYLTSAMLPKLAILALYLRIFTQRRYRYAANTIAFIMILNWCTGFLVALLICKPIRYDWDKTVPGGYCGDIMASYRWLSLANIVTDIAMLILPLPMVSQLQIPRSQKAGLAVTFLTGGVGIITCLIRFVSFFNLDIFRDPTWYVVNSMTWTCVEPGVYFIAATLLSLRPLILKIFMETRFGRFLLLAPQPRRRLGPPGGAGGNNNNNNVFSLSSSLESARQREQRARIHPLVITREVEFTTTTTMATVGDGEGEGGREGGSRDTTGFYGNSVVAAAEHYSVGW